MRSFRPILASLVLTLAAGWAGAADPAASAEEICPLTIGARLPELTLRAGDGSSVNLNETVAAMPTILVFYRGGW